MYSVGGFMLGFIANAVYCAWKEERSKYDSDREKRIIKTALFRRILLVGLICMALVSVLYSWRAAKIQQASAVRAEQVAVETARIARCQAEFNGKVTGFLTVRSARRDADQK